MKRSSLPQRTSRLTCTVFHSCSMLFLGVLLFFAVFMACGPQVAYASEDSSSQGQPLVAASVDYTYEVTPLLAPFNGYVYVKTDNPDPYSFRLIDKSSKYFQEDYEPDAGRGIYHLVERNFLDVKYEKKSTFRVKGGYIFCNRAWDSDGGKLVVQKAASSNPARITYGDGWTSYPQDMNAGWEDTSTKVTCRTMKTYTDYLIDAYTTDSMSFFEKLDAVESGLCSLAAYPRRVLDSSKPIDGRSYPFFATSPYAELSFNEHLDIYESSAGGLLLTAVYPFILDSSSYPGTMSSVARKLNSKCEVSSVSGAHWLINVTLNGTTEVYGYGTPSGNDPIFSKRVKTDFTFDGSDSDFGTKGTLDKLLARYREYGQQANEDATELYAMLSSEAIAKAVAPGGWVRVATEGWFGYGGTYGYIALGSNDSSYIIASDAWVDGHYINEYEQLTLGKTFADHPTANIIVRNQTYTNYYGETRTSDILYWYDSATDTWRAPDYYGNWWSDENLPEQFILTRAQAEALVADPNGKKLPQSGFIFDGSARPGTPFTNVPATGVSLPKSIKVVKGNSDKLDVTVSPNNATEQRVTWQSSDESIVTVSEGTITGVKNGKATITATTLDGGYVAKCTVTVVNSISLSNAVISGVSNKYFTGDPITQVPIVKLGDRTLTEGTHYLVSYQDNLNVGKSTIVVEGTNGYSGKLSISFKIIQAPNKAKAKKRNVTKKLKAKDLKKKEMKVALPKVTTTFGTPKWKVVTADKKKVLSLSGNKIMVKKGAKKSTYSIKLKAKVAKTKNYKAAATKLVTVKVKVA